MNCTFLSSPVPAKHGIATDLIEAGDTDRKVEGDDFSLILCTISLAISYVSHLFVLIFVQCRSISIAMMRTGY